MPNNPTPTKTGKARRSAFYQFTFVGINRKIASELAFALRMGKTQILAPQGANVRHFTVTVQEVKGGASC